MGTSAEESRHEQMFRHDKEMTMARFSKFRPKPVYPIKAVITLSDGTQYTFIPNKDARGNSQADLEISLSVCSKEAFIEFTGIGEVLEGQEVIT